MPFPVGVVIQRILSTYVVVPTQVNFEIYSLFNIDGVHAHPNSASGRVRILTYIACKFQFNLFVVDQRKVATFGFALLISLEVVHINVVVIFEVHRGAPVSCCWLRGSSATLGEINRVILRFTLNWLYLSITLFGWINLRFTFFLSFL
jgi:hypothetical protein